jgi:hypothetical protein
MIKIPKVTLIAYGSHHYTEAQQKALDISSRYIKWGAVKNIIDDNCTSIDKWNEAIIYKLKDHVQTSHCLLIHPDGYVINPEMWTNRWLKYDFIGAPWPMPQDSYSYRDEQENLVRVGNSVSLRSKKLLDLIAQREWKPYYGNTNEDGFICCHNRKWLESKGCKFAPLEVAKYFSKEHEIEENRGIKTFAFHQI